MPTLSGSLWITSNIIAIRAIARCMYLASHFCFWQPFFHLACGQFSCLRCRYPWRLLWSCLFWSTGYCSTRAFGAAIVCAAVLLLSTATMIVNHASVATVWTISVLLIVAGVIFQVVGHRVFERRQPALMDNPTHLLLGPMFVMAKLFIALGFRHDLALVIERDPQQAPSSSLSPAQRHGESLSRS